jgi:O-antigen/teichoic acid export membrane protein
LSELKKKALRGIRWTTISAVFLSAGGLIQTLLFPRLLSIQDFGLMAIVNVALGLSVQLIDMGFSNAILREKQLSNEKLSSFYWINVGMGMSLAVFLWLGAPLVALQFPKLNPDSLTSLLRAITPVFLLSGFAIQYQSLLQKQLRFKLLAAIEILSFIAGFATSLGFALRGQGAFSLVLGAVVKSLCSTLLLLATGIRQHLPRLCFVWAEVRPFASFAAYQSAEKMIAYFAVNIDTIIITKIWAPEHSGVYEVVKRLLIQPWFFINPIVTKVIYPVMAQVQDDLPRLKNIAYRGVQLVSTINVPIYISCAIGAEFIVPVLFGSKYVADGILPFRILSLTFLIRAMINPFGHVLLAKGRADKALTMQIIALTGAYMAIHIGSLFGMSGTLISLLVFNILLCMVSYLYAIKPLIHTKVAELLPYFAPELMLGVCAFGLAYLFAHFMAVPVLAFLLFIGSGSLIYALVLLFIRKNLIPEIKMMLK